MINQELLSKIIKMPGVGRKAVAEALECSEQTARTLCMVRDNYDSIISVKVGKHESGNVLCIGDPHMPFELKDYINHCIGVYNKYNCSEVVFLGDIIDNHYSSFHDTDPDGLGGNEEFQQAKKSLALWYEAFPIAKVCIGNHDAIPQRRAFNAGLSQHWVKTIKEAYQLWGWEFQESFIINNVCYTHGMNGDAYKKAKDEMMSYVCGHSHTKMGVIWHVGLKYIVFGMQVGCGIDIKSYAMAYSKNFKKPAIGCGVVCNGGTLPIIEPMLM